MARTRTPVTIQDQGGGDRGAELGPTLGGGMWAQDLWGNAALASNVPATEAQEQAPASGSSREDITKLTPEYVAAHKQELGIPDEAPIEDFFYEFLAKSLVTRDMSEQDPTNPDLSDADRERILARQQLLESWGYKGTVSEDQEIYDPETGLYAVRFDPLEGEAGQGRNSVMAFRGTEAVRGGETSLDNPLGSFNDVLTDLGPSVGSRQYEPNAEAIRALMEGGTDQTVLTGHSLGGYLAQRVAAENADHTDSVVTYQAGGIDEDDADRFEAANEDGHIDVRHHQTNWDVVHLAGEQRLDGTFFQHNTDGPRVSHADYLMYDDNDATNVVEATGGKDIVTTHEDPVPRWLRGTAEGLRTGVGGLGQVIGSPLVGLWNLGEGLGSAGSNFMDGLGSAGSAFGEGDLWGGATGLLGTGLGLVGDTGQALYSGLEGTLSTFGSGVGQLFSAGENLLEAGWDGATSLAGAAMDGLGSLASGAGDFVGDLAGGALDALTSW